MNYIPVVYNYDSNAILCETMKDKTGTAIVTAYMEIIRLLQSRCLKPKLQRLERKASSLLQELMTAEDIDFQLAPSNMHRRNAAERAIQTCKNHSIAILSKTDPNFPIQIWDQLLDQVQITLNLLQALRINPRLSAHA